MCNFNRALFLYCQILGMAATTSHGTLGSLQSCYLSRCSPSQKGGAMIFMTKFEKATRFNTRLVVKQKFGAIRVLSSASAVIDPIQLSSSGSSEGSRKKSSNQFFVNYNIFLVCIPCEGDGPWTATPSLYQDPWAYHEPIAIVVVLLFISLDLPTGLSLCGFLLYLASLTFCGFFLYQIIFLILACIRSGINWVHAMPIEIDVPFYQ